MGIFFAGSPPALLIGFEMRKGETKKDYLFGMFP